MEIKKVKCRAEGVYQGLSRGAIYDLVYEAAEVTLQLSDSTQRILFFFTKEHLERLVDEISPKAISKALQYLDSQEQLVKMSRPFQ